MMVMCTFHSQKRARTIRVRLKNTCFFLPVMAEGLVDCLPPVDAHGVLSVHDSRHPRARVSVAHLLLGTLLLISCLLAPWPPALLSLLGVTLGLDVGSRI